MSSLVEGHGFAARRSQAVAALGLLALLFVTCLMTDLLARNRGLEHWLMLKSREFADRNGVLFSNTGNFIDFEERVLLDEVPRADYARGGVYFFGTSNMKWAFDILDLPAEQKSWLGNYGIGASSHGSMLQWLRYLIEQRGFLAAGERDLVIIGVSFHLGRTQPPDGYFSSLLRRHGLFEVSPDNRMVAAPMSAVETLLRTEKARSGGLIWNLGRLVKNSAKASTGRTSPPPHNRARYQKAWHEFMGPDWQESIDNEVERLRDTVELIKSRHAQVKVMLLPQGTWMDELPFKARYQARVRAVCQETSTTLIDLSRAMKDEDFVDSNHLTVAGQEKFRGLIMAEIKSHLQKVKQANSALR